MKCYIVYGIYVEQNEYGDDDKAKYVLPTNSDAPVKAFDLDFENYMDLESGWIIGVELMKVPSIHYTNVMDITDLTISTINDKAKTAMDAFLQKDGNDDIKDFVPKIWCYIDA